MVDSFRRFFTALPALLMALTGFFAKPAPRMADYYVSPAGNDENAGRKDSPSISTTRITPLPSPSKRTPVSTRSLTPAQSCITAA